MGEIKSPRVSIGMPVYNGEKHIRQALDTLLAQTFADFELIISDNASTDRTQDICLDYATKDNRIKYYHNEQNKGPIQNFNKVFELSSGKYFMWAAHDDYWKPQYLSSCLKAFLISDSIVLAGVKCESVEAETGKIIFVDEGFSTVGFTAFERFKFYKTTIHSGKHIGSIFYGVYKTEILRKVMPIKKMIANDHLLLAQLCLEGEFFTAQKQLMVKRDGGISRSFRNIACAMEIRNEFLIRCPYFIREIFFQKIIMSSKSLNFLDKIKTSSWSFYNYLKINFLPLLLDVTPRWIRKVFKPTVLFWFNFAKKFNLKRTDLKIRKYITSGQKPWSIGYVEHKERLTSKVLNDREILNVFSSNRLLPAKYGVRIDERVIEYPWFFSRLKNNHALLLDAGSAMNYSNILNLPVLREREIIIFSLNVENRLRINNVSYKYGDLRGTGFNSNFFDEIVCISTLEHIGMDNTFIYSKDKAFKENKVDDYKLVIREFRRLLVPGGKLFLTVPYGKYENMGWQQQFDEKMITEVLKEFSGKISEVTYFKYADDGWQISNAQECNKCVYFDIHKRKDFDSDYVAAARAVACLEIVK